MNPDMKPAAADAIADRLAGRRDVEAPGRYRRIRRPRRRPGPSRSEAATLRPT